jgi:hypothetical protein
MPDTIAQSCALNGSCTISEGSLKPADIIPKLLNALRELAPAVYEQITMPGCGFAMVPAYAMEDHTSDWWDGEACDDALSTLFDALGDHAPEGFEFRMMDGDGSCYGFFRFEPDECEDNECTGCAWCDQQAAIAYKRAECLEAGVEPEAAELRAEQYAEEVAQSRPCFTAGLTPKEVIDRHARLHCTDGFFPMKIVDRAEWQALSAAWNQGIDSHLEAMTERSSADASTGEVRVHVDELSVLCRRLQEYADEVANRADQRRFAGTDSDAEAAENLRSSIIDCIGIEEV